MVRLLLKYVISGYGIAYEQKLHTLNTLHMYYIILFVFSERNLHFFWTHHPILAAFALVNFSEPWEPICYLVTFFSIIGPWAFSSINFIFFVCSSISLGWLYILLWWCLLEEVIERMYNWTVTQAIRDSSPRPLSLECMICPPVAQLDTVFEITQIMYK